MAGFTTLAFISIVLGAVSGTDCPDRWIAFNRNCYLFGHSQPFNFFDAEMFCKRSGGHLVHVDDALENAFITTELGYLKPDSYWLGLTDYVQEGTWVYYDTNTTVTFQGWGPGEPNSYKGEEDCASFLADIQYQWADVPCDAQFEPVCEISADVRPIVG